MKEKIDSLRQSFLQELKEASSSEAVEKLRLAYVGKKGAVTELLKGLKSAGAEQKRELGQHINQLKKQVEEDLAKQVEIIRSAEEQREIDSAERSCSGSWRRSSCQWALR